MLTSENDTCCPAPQASSLSQSKAPTQRPSEARTLDHCPTEQAQGSPNKTQGSPGIERGGSMVKRGQTGWGGWLGVWVTSVSTQLATRAEAGCGGPGLSACGREGQCHPRRCCRLLRRAGAVRVRRPRQPGRCAVDPWGGHARPRRTGWARSWELRPTEAGGVPGPPLSVGSVTAWRPQGPGLGGSRRLLADPRPRCDQGASFPSKRRWPVAGGLPCPPGACTGPGGQID